MKILVTSAEKDKGEQARWHPQAYSFLCILLLSFK